MHPFLPTLALWAAGALPSATPLAPPPPPSGVLAGEVVLGGSRIPVAYADALLLGTRKSSVADTTGRFVIPGLAPGVYEGLVQAIGFDRVRFHAEVRAGETTLVRSELKLLRDGLARGALGRVLRDSIGVDVAGAEDSLRCRIVPFCSHLWPGQHPRFHVVLENHSSRPLLVVRPPRPCSARGFPRCHLTCDGPADGRRWRGRDCVDPDDARLSAGDFITLTPGSQVDLFGRAGHLDDDWDFERPGTYVERFEYMTADDNLRDWLGGNQPDSLDAGWHVRFRNVPRVDLHAECAFEIQQP